MDTILSRSFGLALVLHAGVVAAGRWLPAPVSTPATRAEASYEVSVVEVPGAATSEPAAGSTPSGAAPQARPGGAAVGSSLPRSGSAASVASSGPAGDGARQAPALSETAMAPERPVDLGLGGVWARAPIPDRPSSGWRSGADAAGGLGQGLEARDRDKGLGRGGVVATLARSAAISAGPSEGEASFTVQADREGRVASVILGEARGGAAWGDVAAALRRSLASKRLRIPPGSNGLSVQVLVQARVQLPSGSRPGQAVTANGAGAQFDVADLGARPARVVSARVTSEQLL